MCAIIVDLKIMKFEIEKFEMNLKYGIELLPPQEQQTDRRHFKFNNASFKSLVSQSDI